MAYMIIFIITIIELQSSYLICLYYENYYDLNYYYYLDLLDYLDYLYYLDYLDYLNYYLDYY
jgi:hypothetical protein